VAVGCETEAGDDGGGGGELGVESCAGSAETASTCAPPSDIDIEDIGDVDLTCMNNEDCPRVGGFQLACCGPSLGGGQRTCVAPEACGLF
jgi:hypothetical protein